LRRGICGLCEGRNLVGRDHSCARAAKLAMYIRIDRRVLRNYPRPSTSCATHFKSEKTKNQINERKRTKQRREPKTCLKHIHFHPELCVHLAESLVGASLRAPAAATLGFTATIVLGQPLGAGRFSIIAPHLLHLLLPLLALSRMRDACLYMLYPLYE